MLRIVVDHTAPLATADDACDSGALEGQTHERAGDREREAAPGPAGWFDRWPENPDEVPGWRLDVERRAAEIGFKPPTYRTRGEVAAAAALCESRLFSGLRKIKPRDAARLFADHVRRSKTVTFSNATLSDAFESFCVDMKVVCAENFFRNELKRQPGCRKDVTVTHAPRRMREVKWVIDPITVSLGNRMVSGLAEQRANRVA